MPKRIQLSRRKGRRLPPNTVSVARPSKWGNPYWITQDGDEWLVGLGGFVLAAFPTRKEAAAYAVSEYAKHLTPEQRKAARRELRGKNLACHCDPDDPDQACHADVLLEAASSTETEP